MALPEVIRVKLSSEEAGSIAISPVVVREMPLAELLDWILGVVGKDGERIREILARGTLVSGASRFRWTGIDVQRDEVEAQLRGFPDSDPSRAFDAARCVRVALRSVSSVVVLTPKAPARWRFLRRRSEWERLMELAEQSGLEYLDYSYRDHADRYRLKLPAPVAAEFRAHTADYLVTRKPGQYTQSPISTERKNGD